MKRAESKDGVLKKWRLLAYKAVYMIGKGNYSKGCRLLGYPGTIQLLDPNYLFRSSTFERLLNKFREHNVPPDLLEAVVDEFEKALDDEFAHNRKLNSWFDIAKQILVEISSDGTVLDGARRVGMEGYASRFIPSATQTFGPTAFGNLRAAMISAGADERRVSEMVNAYEESMRNFIPIGFDRPTIKEILAVDYPKRSDYLESKHRLPAPPACVGVDLANESDSTSVHVISNNGSDPSGALGKLASLVNRYREQQKLVDQWFWTELRKQQIPPGVSTAILKWLAPDVRSI